MPVQDWPVGYPLWLALVQSICGVSVNAIRIADSVTLALAAGCLSLWGLRRFKVVERRWLVGFAAATGTTAAARGCGSEFLMLAFLFAALCIIEGIASTSRRAGWLARIALASIVLAAAAQTRHAALAFVPGVCLLLISQHGSLRRALSGCAIASIVVVGTSFGMRSIWEDGNSFPMLSGSHSLGSLVLAMAKGVDRGLGIYPIGVAWFLTLSIAVARSKVGARLARACGVESQQLGDRAAMGFVWASLAALLCMYLLVHVHDLPGSRFVRFASLMVAVMTAGIFGPVARGWRWLLLALVMVPPAAPVLRDVLSGRVVANAVTRHGGTAFLPLNAVAERQGHEWQVTVDGRLLMSAPIFSWQKPPSRPQDPPEGR